MFSVASLLQLQHNSSLWRTEFTATILPADALLQPLPPLVLSDLNLSSPIGMARTIERGIRPKVPARSD